MEILSIRREPCYRGITAQRYRSPTAICTYLAIVIGNNNHRVGTKSNCLNGVRNTCATCIQLKIPIPVFVLFELLGSLAV